MKDRQKRELKLNRWSIYFFAIIFALTGIVLMIFSQRLALKYGNDNIWIRGMAVFGQIIAPMALTSLLFDWFGYLDYARKRLSEVLCEDSVLEILTINRKKELKTALFKDIYLKPSSSVDSYELLTLLDTEMDKILHDYYYQEHITYYDIKEETDAANNAVLFHKNVRRTFRAKAFNPTEDCTLSKILHIRLSGNDSGKSPIKIKRLSINGETLTEKCDEHAPGDFRLNGKPILDYDVTTYETRYTIEVLDKNKLKFKNGMCDIDLEFEIYTSVSDKVIGIVVDKPCKHLCCHFNVNSDNFDISISGNGFMSYGDDQKVRNIKTTNGQMIRFLSWILPGDGAVAVIKDKL